MNLPPSPPDRVRLSLELSPAVALLLDNISDVTGVPRTQLITAALLDALPGLVERSDKIKARQVELERAARALQAGHPGKGGKR